MSEDIQRSAKHISGTLSFGFVVAITFLAVAATSFLVAGGWIHIPRHIYDPACDIKGNIAAEDREKIYHLPADSYYDDALISWLNGERWFCSEDEAQAAGWRRAKI
ncbi:hypothetical protein ASG68_29000 [Rhizobium sp. Leaf453]|nr:hypothetical protein ASG50_25920 [Rhizobium sp. Leaf386]KQS95675.1 hypothetical protein ASG42_29655 [Rhizobium sp. Leaf391]KQU01902.1 hypothetical protein ASG68_29000 [Rhizobium sp. Leaf453]